MMLLPLLAKELKELVRSYKLLFVPLAFALLGLSQPITFKLLPQLMKTASNLPPGAVIEIPVPAPGEIVAGALGQFSQLGLLILILVTMGAVAGERMSGVAATVLTKPVGRGEYLAAKAIGFGLLATLSLALGMTLAAYYTQVLFAPVDWGGVAAATLLYLPNLLLAVAVTLCCSVLFGSPVAAGGAALAAMVVVNLVPKYLGKFLASVSPGALSEAAGAAAAGAAYAAGRPLGGVLALTLLALAGGWMVLRRQEM